MDKTLLSPIYLNSTSQSCELDIPRETLTQDENLKLKLRSLNLIKYNPNLFTNKQTGYIDLIGGNKSLAVMLGMGSLFALYRGKVNNFRQMSTREGIWMVNLWFVYGALVGKAYSLLFFHKSQQHLNEYYAFHLMKRYKGADQISRRNIYQYKDIPNGDECFNFSNKFSNYAH
jgi:hypothetical protein